MEETSNKGKFLLWLMAAGNDPDLKNPFFMLGKIDKTPAWEDGILWVHTQEYYASQDAHWLCSLDDAYFHPQRKEDKEENYINVGDECLSVLVLGVFDKLDQGRRKRGVRHVLPRQVRTRAKYILNMHKNLAIVKAFTEKSSERPSSHKRPAKTT